jgi:hypothetical protein
MYLREVSYPISTTYGCLDKIGFGKFETETCLFKVLDFDEKIGKIIAGAPPYLVRSR